MEILIAVIAALALGYMVGLAQGSRPSSTAKAAAQFSNDELSARRIGKYIVSNSHWFSEDVSAMNAVNAVGEALRDHGAFGVSEAREVWRRLNKASKHQ